jgi:pimeloyl-ACP methyl ester carboxylesterase
MPIEKISGTDLSYYLLAFDENGIERKEADGAMLSRHVVEALAALKTTDVFLFAHGWKGDVPAAREQYERWIRMVTSRVDDIPRLREITPGFRALLIGLHWPSLPWGDEMLQAAASFAAPAFAVPGDPEPPQTDLATLITTWVDEYAARIADTPPARAALQTILTAAFTSATPPNLPADVAEAYRVLDHEAGLVSDGEAGAPGHDREPFDPEAAYQRGLAEDNISFSGFSFGGLLSPLRQLSFWKMKDRARAFGEAGAHELLKALQEAAPDARFHLMGHSFGCIVASAMLAGPGGKGKLPRPVETLALIQGALSLWSYCTGVPSVPGQAGYFRPVLGTHAVRGAMFSTQSVYDTAVGKIYPLGAGVARQVSFAPGEFPTYGALGAFGIRGPGCDAIDCQMAAVTASNGFERGKIYNVESSAYITGGSGFSGAHNEIDKPEVAHAFWEAVIASHGQAAPTTEATI